MQSCSSFCVSPVANTRPALSCLVLLLFPGAHVHRLSGNEKKQIRLADRLPGNSHWTFCCWHTNNNKSAVRHHHPRRRLREEGNRTSSSYLERAQKEHFPRLQVVSNVTTTVLGPSVFPKPIRVAQLAHPNQRVVPHLTTPVHGSHRHDQDAVFIFAAEYSVKTYLLFLTSLRQTGYDGDVVVCISRMDWKKTQIRQYLQLDAHVIVYVIDYGCFNAEMMPVDSSKGGIRVCQVHGLYAIESKEQQEERTAIPDPRPPRHVPSTRYEIYHMIIHHYSKHSWILLIDARDTAFQRNPFAALPRQGGGLLYFFGENQDATRIGSSKWTRGWIAAAYGEFVAEQLADKPTICSGSTMGEQVALEAYLRAMVAEQDETGTQLMGADQGFHNYLYYSNKLANSKAIKEIHVFDQGFGIVNNLGALRTKKLEEWGNGMIVKEGPSNELTVLNWDGSVSPVVHQFDRHKPLSDFWFKVSMEKFWLMWKNQEEKVNPNVLERMNYRNPLKG